ncbi:MAG: ABC transporter permease subunit [Acetobacteraceae bacterium]
MILFLEQALNGLQFGAMLFLMAAGLTLVFGIMGLVNLAHGSFYMVGAYAAAWTANHTHSFLLAVLAGMTAAALVGAATELPVLYLLNPPEGRRRRVGRHEWPDMHRYHVAPQCRRRIGRPRTGWHPKPI